MNKKTTHEHETTQVSYNNKNNNKKKLLYLEKIGN